MTLLECGDTHYYLLSVARSPGRPGTRTERRLNLVPNPPCFFCKVSALFDLQQLRHEQGLGHNGVWP